jgi:hypothetical protein
MKNIRRKDFDIKGLRLSPEEGFVLSRLDAPLTSKELVSLTGLDESRVVEIIETLATQGVVDLDRDGAAPTKNPSSARMPAVKATSAASSSSGSGVALVSSPPDEPQLEEVPPDEPQLEEVHDDEPPVEGRAAEDKRIEESDSRILAEAAARGANTTTEGEEPPDEVDNPEEEEKRVQGEREYQKIYEQVYHPMPRDERIAAAEQVDNPDLFALCYDPEPQIIHAILSNPKAGLPHARMIALHHRTQAGLELIGRRTEFVADAQTQRRLLANPQLPGTILRRIISPKLIMEVYKIAINREIPERSRVMTRELLQKKFMLGSPEERAALLIKTEGRCLILLVNCALDARTTQILTAKTSFTILFIQNLARWSACPPALLVHLLKQPVVRMNIGLRKMLLKHPNVPSETKRNFQ